MESREQVESSRPSILSAAVSPTALSNLLASFSLLVCFFLPHSVGCNNQSHRPLTIAVSIATESSDPQAFLALAALWPYALALATLAVMAVLIVLRPPWFAKALLGLPIAASLGLTLLWTMYLFGGSESSRMAMGIAAVVAPIGTCVIARVFWLYRDGQTAAAAAWGQGLLCVLAVFSLRWFWFPPIIRMLWGGILSIASAILMMLASWSWVTRSRHDLWDRSVEPAPFQVSLRQLIVAISLTAVALTYWRTLGHWDP
jgi:hypothetical protein